MRLRDFLKKGAISLQVRPYKIELLCKLLKSKTAVAESVTKKTALTGMLPVGHNIVGFGFGSKKVAVQIISECALRVYVRKKLARSKLSKKDLVPDSINGLPTDVIEVGEIRANARPVECGVSIGHFGITAGTLGCLLKVSGQSGTFILSNNHVLANCNAAVPGDNILEPGPIDGGDPADPIANLTDFEPLDFSGASNVMDAAIAKVIHDGDVLSQIQEIGSVASQAAEASMQQNVKKSGRTTRQTVGTVVDLAADVSIGYSNGRNAHFADLLAIDGSGGLFTGPGDSGSLILDAIDNTPLALHIAAGILPSDGHFHSFACRIRPILTRFNARIL